MAEYTQFKNPFLDTQGDFAGARQQTKKAHEVSMNRTAISSVFLTAKVASHVFGEIQQIAEDFEVHVLRLHRVHVRSWSKQGYVLP